MSGGSIGTVVGGIIGAIIGTIVPVVGTALGFALGASIGGAVGTVLDPPKGIDQFGPRLDDLSVQTSSYGVFIPRIYGSVAVWGNIFWLENNALKEVETTESQGGKGGGGGAEVTTYAYFATFALGLCEGPIAGIGRIWIGGKLFYEPDSLSGVMNSQYFRIYNGTEEQLPDGRMQMTLGVANVPAYRGLAYIVFYDLPLKDYGNSLVATQIKVEVFGCRVNRSFSLLYSTPTIYDSYGIIGSENLVFVLVDHEVPGAYERYLRIYDVTSPEAAVLLSETISVQWARYVAIAYNLIIVFSEAGDIKDCEIFDYSDPWRPISKSVIDFPAQVYAARVYGYYIYTVNYGSDELRVYDCKKSSDPVIKNKIIVGDKPYFLAIDGNYLVIGYYLSGRFDIYDISTPAYPIFISTTDAGSDIEMLTLSKNLLYISVAGSFFKIYDIANPLVPDLKSTTAFTLDGGITAAEDNLAYLLQGMHGKYETWDVSDPANPFLVQSIDTGQEIRGINVNSDLIFISNGVINEFKIYHHAVVNPTLGEVVGAECLVSNLLEAADIDVTDLTQTVRGYRVSSLGAIRAGIEPLRGAWPFDVVQHGFKIKFVKRGQTAIADITEDELDAREAGAESGVSVTSGREMDSQLPRRVNLKYFDSAREYDNGEQYAERLNTDAINIRELELALVLTAAEAAQIVTMLLYLYWMERYDIAFKLPPVYGYLEPGDVVTLTTDYAVFSLRLTSISYTAKGFLECRAKYNDAAIYTQVAPGVEGPPATQGITVPGYSNYVLLDIPLLDDVYDMPGFPVAMTGYLSGWPGGIIYRSEDGGQSWRNLQAFSSTGSRIGYALDTLGAHDGCTLDKSNLLTVKMYHQSQLASVTEAQMFAAQNWFAYGDDQRWEIIAAQNCMLQGDGSYVLSDFLRGQFGTEWATGLHAADDKIIYLSSRELHFTLANSSSIGVEKLYRGITAGKALDTDSDRAFTYRGENLEPLSPCALTGNRHPTTNDWTLTWTRRSRFGAWRDLIDAELGETSESYTIEIYSSNTYATLKRTLSASAQTVSYSSANQVTDFGSNQGTLYLKIYQVSSVVGTGRPLIASITR